jgi:poly-gamma-glutamate synthesis protein (capsule biosynthesis protein)
LLTEENLTQDIERAKEKAHVVIVSIHWGTEYEQSPTERQRMFAHLAVDSGASLILGHHPHVVQPVEQYKDGYIFYSLGNFVFDQMWSEETRNGLIARIFFEGRQIKKVETITVTIYEFHQPRPEDWE